MKKSDDELHNEFFTTAENIVAYIIFSIMLGAVLAIFLIGVSVLMRIMP